MILTGKFTYLGTEKFHSRTDSTKIFTSLVLLQGTDVTKVFLQDADIPKIDGLNHMENVECSLDIKVGQKTYISLVEIKKATAKVA